MRKNLLVETIYSEHSEWKVYKDEADFTAYYLTRLRESWIRGWKIPDEWRKSKPCDSIIVSEKWTFFLEFKYLNDEEFDVKKVLKKLEMSQVTAFSGIDKIVKGICYVIAYYPKLKTFYIINYSHARKLYWGS